MHCRLLIFLFCVTFSKLVAHEGKTNSPFVFTENKGQWSEGVKYKSDVEGATIFFESNAFHYQFRNVPDFHLGNQPEDPFIRGHVFNANFVGSNSTVAIEKKGSSPFYYNYYIGKEESKWASKVRSYREIEYRELYNGIDLKVYLQDGFMKYDYHVSPTISPDLIEVEYEGVDELSIREGALVIRHSLGELVEESPYAYQFLNGEQKEVPCFYKVLENGHIGFEFPEGYDQEVELIIDPTLVFATYSGSTADNFGQTATYDESGNGYMGGIANGSGYVVTTGAYQRAFGGSTYDIAISKFNSTGDSLEYSTYIGGSGNETVHSLVVDAAENLYLLGASSSPNYPTTPTAVKGSRTSSTGAIVTDIGVRYTGGVDIVVTKFNKDGTNLLGSTYYGGSNSDGINQNPNSTTSTTVYDGLNFNYGDYHRGEIIIDSSGACYIGTTTYSDNLATITNSRGGGQDGLIVKFNSDLSSVAWSRYLGGSGRDAINSLKVIDNNRVLVGGGTSDFTNFPTTPNAYRPVNLGGESDGFIAIISSDGTTLEKSALVGTSNYDQVYFIEFDRFNQVYAYGQSEGGTFPTKNSPNSDVGAGQFILKMDSNLDSLVFSKTFGDGQGNGTVNISPTAFLVDKCQNIYAAGWGGSIRPGVEGTKILGNLPIQRDTVFGSINTSAFYIYVTYLDPSDNEDTVLYANLIGGSASDDHVDGGTSRFDKDGVIYHSVCASCGSATSDFPTTPTAYSQTDNSPFGRCNNLIFKIDLNIAIDADFSLSKNEICLLPGTTDSIVVFNRSVGSDITTWDFYGDTVLTKFVDTTIYFSTPGVYNIRQIVEDTICAIDAIKDLSITIRPDDIEITTATQDSSICLNDSAKVSAFTNGFATNFVWSRNKDFSNPINLNPSDSTPTLALLTGKNTFYVEASDPTRDACEKNDSISVFYTPVNVSATISADSVCFGTPVQFSASFTNVDTFLWRFGNGQVNRVDVNPQILYNTSGNQTTTFIYENETCDEKDSVSLNLFVQANDLMFNIPSDTLYCGLGVFNVSLSSSGTINQYIYSSNRDFSDTLNANLQTNSINLNGNDSSRYYLKINNNFCENTDSILIEYIEYSVELSPIIDTVCTPYSVQVNSTVIGVDSFRITGSNGFSTTTDLAPQITFDTEGVFDISLVGSNARCNVNSSDSETINVFQSVPLAPVMDTLICIGAPVRLVGNSQGVANEFVWSDNPSFADSLPTVADSILQITPTQGTTYYFKATNVVCESVDTVVVDVEELIIDVDEFRSICIFDTIQMEALINTASSALSYTWAPNDSILTGQSTKITEAAPRNDMFFYLATTSQTGCLDFDTIEVEVNLPAFDDAVILGIDSLYKGQSTQLFTDRNGNNLVYSWEPPEGIDNVNSSHPNVTLDSSKEYLVTITDLNTNCEVIARRRLFVFEVNCAEPDIFVPTAFTPNGDSNNDVLYVRGANLREIEFQLFNRWGELVFETKELNKGWNGTYQGKVVDPGVFVYQLKAICFDGQEYIGKGNITLIR